MEGKSYYMEMHEYLVVVEEKSNRIIEVHRDLTPADREALHKHLLHKYTPKSGYHEKFFITANPLNYLYGYPNISDFSEELRAGSTRKHRGSLRKH